MLLRQADEYLGLTSEIASALEDPGQKRKCEHSASSPSFPMLLLHGAASDG